MMRIFFRVKGVFPFFMLQYTVMPSTAIYGFKRYRQVDQMIAERVKEVFSRVVDPD
jgi:hypothetical protein